MQKGAKNQTLCKFVQSTTQLLQSHKGIDILQAICQFISGNKATQKSIVRIIVIFNTIIITILITSILIIQQNFNCE